VSASRHTVMPETRAFWYSRIAWFSASGLVVIVWMQKRPSEAVPTDDSNFLFVHEWTRIGTNEAEGRK
jgi:hypothetical protein